MPRASEIAADARALYGPPSVRPAAGDMGDGALWVDPGASQSLWQVQSGNWRQIALPSDDDSSIPAGVPVLRGPYVVEYTDIPTVGASKTLWTPQVGDILYGIMCDQQHGTDWDHGTLALGTAALPSQFNSGFNPSFFSLLELGWLHGSTSPVQISLYFSDGTPNAAGHIELYALVARAIPVTP